MSFLPSLIFLASWAGSSDLPIQDVEGWLENAPQTWWRSHADEAKAAQRNGLAPLPGEARARQRMLADLMPFLVVPDSVQDAMLLSEAWVYGACKDERKDAEVWALQDYAKLQETLPDSLLPAWKDVKYLLITSRLRNQASCRAKLRGALTSLGRQDCEGTLPSANSQDDAQTDSLRNRGETETIYWSPACLQILQQPDHLCLIASKSGCWVDVAEYNATAADFSAPRQGDLGQTQTEILHHILRQKYRKPAVASHATSSQNFSSPDSTPSQSVLQDTVFWMIGSDSTFLSEWNGPWNLLPAGKFPQNVRLFLDTLEKAGTNRFIRTHYGMVRFHPETKPAPFTPAEKAWQNRLDETQKAWQRYPQAVEAMTRDAYQSGGGLWNRPDTLEYSLWLTPVQDSDTMDIQPLTIQTHSVDGFADSVAWKAQLRGKVGIQLGPYASPLGTLWLRVERFARGNGKIPFAESQPHLLRGLATAWELGRKLGLWREENIEPMEASTPEIDMPGFKHKREWVLALAKLEYSRANLQGPEWKALEALPLEFLKDRYQRLQGERELGRWIRGFHLTAEAAHLGLAF
jgi:hypothetical protein